MADNNHEYGQGELSELCTKLRNRYRDQKRDLGNKAPRIEPGSSEERLVGKEFAANHNEGLDPPNGKAKASDSGAGLAIDYEKLAQLDNVEPIGKARHRPIRDDAPPLGEPPHDEPQDTSYDWLSAESFSNANTRMKDALKSKPAPRQMLIPGLMPKGLVGALVAATKVGKTYFMIMLCVCAVLGRRFFHFDIPRRFPIVYLNGEDPKEEFERRLWDICEHFGVTPADLDDFHPFHLDDKPRELTTTAFGSCVVLDDAVRALAERIKRLPNGPGLVVVDTLSQFHGGNEGEHLKVFVKALKRLRGLCGWTVMTTHHISQDAMAKGNGLKLHGARGHTGFISDIRFQLAMQTFTEQDAQDNGVNEDCREDFLYVGNPGFNFGKRFDPFPLRRLDNGILVPANVSRGDGIRKQQTEVNDRLIEAVEMGMTEYSVSKLSKELGGQVIDGFKMPSNKTLVNHIEYLVRANRLIEKPASKGNGPRMILSVP